jgi:hypothetical protein
MRVILMLVLVLILMLVLVLLMVVPDKDRLAEYQLERDG